MSADKILGNMHTWKGQEEVVEVNFFWFEMEKKRISKTACNGETIGVCIEETLKEGDVIAKEDDTIYVVSLQPELLIQVEVSSMEEMGRLGFELGNRHLSLQIDHNIVRVPFDSPTFSYLQKLGFHVEKVEAKFQDYIVCKAHGNSSGHSHEHAHGEHQIGRAHV